MKKTKDSPKKAKQGLTAATLLIILTIVGFVGLASIGILVALSMVGYGIAQRITRDTARKMDVASIEVGLEDYFAENGTYPESSNVKPATGNKQINIAGDYVGLQFEGKTHVNNNLCRTYNQKEVSCINYTKTVDGYILEVKLEGSEEPYTKQSE